MALSLTATAMANSADRRAQAQAVTAGDTTGVAAKLFVVACNAAFSCTASAEKIFLYDSAGEVLDTRRCFVAYASGSVRDGMKAFAQAQGAWLVRREAFEDLWEHGRRLVYGALTIGGMGVEGRFGPFCLVVDDPERHVPDALAVFPGDTAQRYTDAAGAVDVVGATTEATTWAERAHLVVIHRLVEAQTRSEAEWPDVMCRPNDYLEATVAGWLPLPMIGQVRMRPEFRDRLRTLRARSLAGDRLDPTENNELRAYETVTRWRHTYSTLVVEVA